MKSRSFNLLVSLALFLSLLGSAVTVTPAHAANFTVNTTNDTPDLIFGDGLCQDAAGNCSLRAAFLEAQVLGGADTITLPAGTYTLTLGSALSVNTPVILNGSGAASTIIQASTCDPITTPGGCTPATTSVIFISALGSLTLNDVTIQNGNSGSDGGGIRNTGSLTINNSIIKNNKTALNGGGISISSSLYATQINNTTFENNTSGNSGGHIFVNLQSAGTSLVTNSTFSKGQAVNGGAIANFAGTIQTSNINISNSTFINNSSSQNGGAVFTSASNSGSKAQTLLINSTVAYNTAAGRGGGVAVNNNNNGGPQATITMKNSLIYGNSASVTNPNCDAINVGSTLVGNANNLFPASGDFCPTGASDITTSAAFNTIVSSLGSNGGLTQTMELPAGSPAIDAGNAATCAAAPVSGKDQRGVTRPQGAGCDIGAFETGPIIPVVTASNPSASAVLTSLNTINVTFNQDMVNDGTDKAANYKPNYILVERGANGSFDTTSCNGGVVSDDSPQTINTANYSNNGGVYIATLTFNSLAAGTYRLFVCGTTSVWSVAGLELNNGANDATVDFTVSTGTAAATSRTGKTDASSLPKTGFAPGKVTILPAQPAALEYAELGDLWLEIPSLNVKSTIVGVPQNADKTWSVDWLGNDTGWLNGTAFPTWTGNSVLTAHVTNADGLDGPFAALKSLKYGDQIIVHMGGGQYVYEVRNTRLARPYSTSYAFESKQDASYLTLITCSGYNPLNESYLFRRVVRLVLVEVKGE